MSAALPIGFGLMCKPPRPGTSKTRLAAAIGNEAAALLSATFLRDCADAAIEASRLSSLDLAAFYRPRDASNQIGALLGPAWRLDYADAGDLGATMLDILSRLLSRCPAGAMLMGADIPMIAGEVIDRAARALRDGTDASVVIAPSADGGYCLIGVKSVAAATPLLESMAWSTPEVLDETLRRAHRSNLEVTILDMQRDIDEQHDVLWLCQAVDSYPERARATRRALDALALPQRSLHLPAK